MRTQTLRHLAVAASVVALALPAQAQPRNLSHSAGWSARSWLESFQARSGPERVDKTTRTFKVGASGSLAISNISGDIVVSEGGGDTITIEAFKKVRARDEATAREQFANTNIGFTDRAGRVDVRVTYAAQRHNNAWVDFVVTAPAGTAIDAHSVSGDITITAIKGEIRAESVSGDVTLHQVPRVTLAKSVSGDVEVDGANGNDELNVNSVSGDLTVRQSKARRIDAETVSGDVEMRDVSCERATAKSTSGDVTYDGTLTKGGEYQLQSHSGEIHLMLPSGVGFELSAQTFSGNLRSDLPVTFKGFGSDRPGDRHRTNRRIQGTVGDGSALVTLNSFSGDITISRR